MNYRKKGLIIGETPVGDSDKFLTVLTAEEGQISIYAHAVRSYKSKYLNIARPINYCEFEVMGRGDKFWMREMTPLETFSEIYDDLTGFALAQYFMEVACEVTTCNSNEEQMLRLLLNLLYSLSKSEKPQLQIKAVFELKCAAIEGFAPDLSGCAVCGRQSDGVMYFDIMNGSLSCSSCYHDIPAEAAQVQTEDTGTARIIRQITPTVHAAAKFIVETPMKRMLAFSLDNDVMSQLSSLSQCYLTNHLERSFPTLEFYCQSAELEAKTKPNT